MADRALFRKAEVDQRIGQMYSSLTQLEGQYSYVNAISSIQGQIDRLQGLESKFFNSINIKGNLEQQIAIFKQRVLDAQQSTLNFSGPQLQQVVIGEINKYFTRVREEYNKDFITYMSNNQAFQQMLSPEKLKGATAGEAVRAVLQAFPSTMTTTEKGTKSNRPFTSQKGHYANLEKILLSKLSQAQRKRGEEFVDHYRKLFPELSCSTTINDDSISSSINWYSLTNGLTRKQAEALSGKNSGMIDQINDAMCDYIVSLFNGSDKNAFREIVRYMISRDRYLFFVGKNVQQITGLMGEIQGMWIIYAITHTMPGSQSGFQWIANTLNNGKKAHEDIILNGIGFQVKNSTKDITNSPYLNSVSFASLNVESMLNLLGFSDTEKSIINTIYGTYHFNVEYQYNSKIGFYEESPNEIFHPTRQNLETLVKVTERLFAAFAVTLMYIQTGQMAASQSGNSIYLLGAGGVMTASQVLISIFQKLQSVSASIFHITSSIMPGDRGTIPEALNRRNGRSAHQVLEDTLEHLTLTSSFDFKNILPH